MELVKFRITHSMLIEHYQFIEAHLAAIYAALSGKSMTDGLQDVEKIGLFGVVKQIQKIDQSCKQRIFTGDEYERLRRISQRRNFWCHNCYFNLKFDRKTGDLLEGEDMRTMISDLQEAGTLREELHKKASKLLQDNVGTLLGKL